MSLTYDDGVVHASSAGQTLVLTPNDARILRRELSRAIKRGQAIPLVIDTSAARDHMLLTVDDDALNVPPSQRAVARVITRTQAARLVTHADEERYASIELVTD